MPVVVVVAVLPMREGGVIQCTHQGAHDHVGSVRREVRVVRHIVKQDEEAHLHSGGGGAGTVSAQPLAA
jgi:hypothetical protein